VELRLRSRLRFLHLAVSYSEIIINLCLLVHSLVIHWDRGSLLKVLWLLEIALSLAYYLTFLHLDNLHLVQLHLRFQVQGNATPTPAAPQPFLVLVSYYSFRSSL